MNATAILNRATAGPSSAVAVTTAGVHPPAVAELPPDPSRDYFPGLTGPIDFVLLDAHLLFTRPPEGAECLADVVRRVAG